MGSLTTTQEVADYVISKLKGTMTIHRYDAATSKSVYLKFDYGVANSLRISDHTGKKHLAYRFNIGFDVKEPHTKTQGGYPREFYPVRMVDRVIETILEHKQIRQQRYRSYQGVVEKEKLAAEAPASTGFWSHCHLVSEGGDNNA